MKKIGIAGDHAGYSYKEEIKSYLKSKNYQLVDFGPDSEESCDYPDMAHPLAIAIEKKELDMGIAICGSGNGINMTLNKHQEIRSALSWNKEIASLARMHNDANVVALPARFISIKEALEIVDVFLSTDFEGGRHLRRVNKISINHE